MTLLHELSGTSWHITIGLHTVYFCWWRCINTAMLFTYIKYLCWPVGAWHGQLFSNMERVACLLHSGNPGTLNPAPWGGIQLILTGDLLQLPPISKAPTPCFYCSQTDMWDQTIPASCTLHTVYRHTDPGSSACIITQASQHQAFSIPNDPWGASLWPPNW